MLLGQPKETNPTLGACFVLDIAQSLLGGSYSRARILPEWLTKNYTADTSEANNLFARGSGVGRRDMTTGREGAVASAGGITIPVRRHHLAGGAKRVSLYSQQAYQKDVRDGEFIW